MNIYMLIDRSGSMKDLWNEAIGSINTYAQKVADTARFYVAVFDSTSYDVLRDLNADKWVDIRPEEAYPRNMTPLYDAAGRLFDKVITDKPKEAVIVIMTDGAENSSTDYTLESIKKRMKDIERLEYPIVFLGAQFKEVYTQAKSFGVDQANTVNLSRERMREGMEMFGARTTAYAQARMAGASYADASATMNFTADEQSYLGGDTPTSITTDAANAIANSILLTLTDSQSHFANVAVSTTLAPKPKRTRTKKS